MHRHKALVLIPASLLALSSLALSQDMRVVRIGVPVMKNDAGRSVSGVVERDRLVKALSSIKPDKKLHVKTQGVALDGSSPEEAVAQAEDKKCDYIVYTTLTELRTQGDPAQRPRNGIETNPNSQWNTHGAESAAMNPEYRATVEYELHRTGDPSVLSGVPFSTQEAMTEVEVVSQIMDRIANRVFAEVKKAPTP